MAYGLDLEQVTEILMGETEAHADVLGGPGSRVFSREFGDFSLNFRIMNWVKPWPRGF